ncbi:hypothetical protein DFH29DRAFT_882147 [Suillus ampliporus]|nr:hypothetical protein DFH29DRAFT_882147 [Suillus ampliporus]
MNNTFYGCVAGNVANTTLCCNELGGKLLSANGSYGCAFVQNQFPATLQSIFAWRNCSDPSSSICELPVPSLNYTGLPSGYTSGGVGMCGSGIGGSLMIGMLLFGVMAQMALITT